VAAGLDAANSLSSPAGLLGSFGLSFALWAASATASYVVMRAFALPVPPAAALLVVAITNLGMAVPSAPAYVGVYHLLAIETLRLFGVDPSAGLSYAVTMHALTFGSFIVGGLGFLWHRHLTFGDLWGHAVRPSGERAAAGRADAPPPAAGYASSQNGCDQAVRPAASLASTRTQRAAPAGR
jgi:hypothetical protein